MTDEYEVITCPACNANYVNQTACPRCEQTTLPVVQKPTQSRKKAPKPKASNPLAIKDTPLSYTDYQTLSPNTVSVAEYNRYLYLHDLQSDGVISNLETQIKYEVLPRVRIKPAIDWYKGFTQSRVTYSPDFRYQYAGLTIVEEYKALNFGTKKNPLKTPRPLIKTPSRKSIKELIARDKDFVKGLSIFIIVCWNRKTGRYQAFNANSSAFSYPLANYTASYIELELAS